MISDVSQDDIEKAEIIPSINSNHSAIFLHFNGIDKPNHGPSFVNDDDFVALINESVPLWLKEFKEEVTDKRLLWDLIN